MKVIQITERYPPAIGGVETHVSCLSRELKRLGVDVMVLTTDLVNTRPMRKMFFRQNPSLDENGIVVYRARAFEALPLRQGLGVFSPGMLSRLRGADLIHAHGYGHFPTYAALFRPRRTPMVVTTHSDAGNPSLRKAVFDATVPLLTIRRADRVIALSRHEESVLVSRGVSPGSIRVIPNGVIVGGLAGPGRTLTGGAVKRLLFVGRIDFEQKGVDLLLLGASLLVKKGRQVVVTFVGPDWGDLRAARALSRELEIGSKVRFLGVLSKKELQQEMAASDVLILPSRFEPFGIVILEAMSAGLPVLAANVGGIRELVTDGFNGLLFEKGDPQSLAMKLEILLGDEEYGRKLARNATSGLGRFAWDKVAEETLRVYEQTLSDS